jgi:S-adenosylmethionine/arginine decarboxylase-like enzyme
MARRKGNANPRYGPGDINQMFSPERGEKIPWGLATQIDLYRCNPGTIRDADKIRDYVAELCVLIGMKRFGKTRVVHFGENERVEGFSMTQFIETSLISGHFANESDSAYLDIFSCSEYDPRVAARFSKEFFGAKQMEIQVNPRGRLLHKYGRTG